MLESAGIKAMLHESPPSVLRVRVTRILGFALLLGIAEAAEWQPGVNHRSLELKVPTTGRAYLLGLTPAATGITFTNFLSEEKGLEDSLRTSGSGVAAGDVDGDGWCDLYFCRMEGANALYRNLGNWRFEDTTSSAGVACADQYSTGAAFADVDGDGDLDLLVNSLGAGTRLFFNTGQGKFAEVPEAGLVRKFGSTSMALADIDGNGTLDLYVCNYATRKIEDRPNAKFEFKTMGGRIVITAIDGVPTTSPELTNRYFVDAERVVRELGEPDIFYLNTGGGKFREVPWTDGTFLDEQSRALDVPHYDFGLAVMFRDMNGDLAPDIYICNDLFPPDRIWVNDGQGRFRAMSNLAVRNTSRFSMGVDFADIDRDGYDDFFVVDMLSREHQRRKVQTVGVIPMFLPIGQIDNRPQYKRNTLFLNRGDGTYAEIGQLSGLDATEWSWMPLFLDVDLDGFEDVLVTTGHTRDSLHADAVERIVSLRSRRKLSDAEHRALKKQFFPVLTTPIQAFRNRGDLTFEDKAMDWGIDYVGITHGMCLADLDNDGDSDVIAVPLNDAARLYRNESAAPRVAVRLKGKTPNTRGIGAKIKFFGGPVAQSQQMMCGGRYLSSDDTMRMFAVGQVTSGLSLEVTWRNGSRNVVTNVQPNRLYEIEERSDAGGPSPVAEGGASKPGATSQRPTKDEGPGTLFEDVSHLIAHSHVDDWFNDFERQPLLGKKLSQLGPGVSWYDWDGDGWEDLIVGSGVGGRLAVYRNNGQGGFQRWEKAPLDQPVTRDQTTILGWPKTNGQRALLVGSSNYEDSLPRGSCVREFDLARQSIHDRLPPWECSTGPLALADWDGDGILDLFVGGRALPGRYPEEPFSLLFRGTGSGFDLHREGTKQLVNAGMVSGAVFSDLDADGLPELILACEWGPVRILGHKSAKWQDLTAQLGLEKYLGWWNGVATGDFDSDGRLDIVASNWGRNGRYQSYRDQPLRIYYGDWKGKGTVDGIETYYESRLKKWMPWCSVAVAKSVPWLSERFATHQAFGAASVAEVLGERITTARVLQAAWLDTTLFLNRGDHFEAAALPIEAQFAPALSVSVGDMDGNGSEDVFLSQNFFAVDGDTPRYDAGRGLWLAGDGKGKFRPVAGQASGVKVYGEQRGCALCDYDADGRLDLAVTQNGAETKLYRNVGAKPGLRVKLRGPAGNPDGVGALLRLISSDTTGPAREIQAGSGYWSQNGLVQVLALAKPPAKLWLRWPGGKVTTTDIPAGAREITIVITGTVKDVR